MDEQNYLPLSGLQHFAFCRRQWALIHIENLWAENVRTVDGQIMHENAHDSGSHESRGDVKITRGMYIHSPGLGLSGQCDVVEFRRNDAGIPMPGWDGRWLPYPIEYKRGSPKVSVADRLQLCAQAMCLEEMLCCPVPQGALFYGQTRRRETVDCTPELREQVRKAAEEMHDYFRRGHTPKARRTRSCNACSLQALCIPGLARSGDVQSYLRSSLEEST